MAEIFAEQHGTAAADGSLGDQGIKPTELMPQRQLVGIENQIQLRADNLKASHGGKQGRDLCIAQGRPEFAGRHRAQLDQDTQRLVSTNTRIRGARKGILGSRVGG